ncbi:MAG TPA: ABC transporter permease, partial [Isosphaeraceae bacterium]|nr:ABC transporter permease [Isosphaeraceae bacterium]
MRRTGWLTLALALGLAWPVAPAVAKDKPKAQPLGSSAAYDTLGQLAVLHQGRIKPLDTVARQTIKQIYGNDTIKLDQPPTAWGPVGALIDMVARPEFWDEQPIIRVDYQPLKSLILTEPTKQKLKEIAARETVSAADRARIEEFCKADKIDEAGLLTLVRGSSLKEEDRQPILELADRFKGSSRWVTPKELETAKIQVEGQQASFDSWLADISTRMGNEEMPVAGRPNLAEVEKKAYEAGIALRHYQAVRGDQVGRLEPLDMYVPRPHNEAYLKFTADIQAKKAKLAHDQESFQNLRLTALEQNADEVLKEYLKVTQKDDVKMPGTDTTSDARFTGWLKEKAGWIPLHTILEADPADLVRAGYPASEMAAFRDAYKTLVDAEIDKPGQVDDAKTSGLVLAARKLGDDVGGYPSQAAVSRETFFNAFSPFYKASLGYGLALVLLLISVGITADRGSAIGLLGRVLKWGGMAAFVAGIALEAIGFYFRVRISGWAPVTNMYETVIWVALITAVLGLVFELIFGRTFPALAGSGVAFLTTTLAYKVSLLDPNIHSLTPVLRSNYWLGIHVLTEVSSYAAFALAMGLGLIGTFIYLTATYRRDVEFSRLAKPLLPGLPMLVLGAAGVWSAYNHAGPAWLATRDVAFYASASIGLLGGIYTITSLAAMVGEAVSRALFARRTAQAQLAEAGSQTEMAPAATSVQTVTVSEGGAAVATLSRPTVAEIRARAAASRPQLDARGQAMQATAAQ